MAAHIVVLTLRVRDLITWSVMPYDEPESPGETTAWMVNWERTPR